ncbi:MAG: isochorismatase family protein [Chloroflexi bacterium]|nr:isochorismatase family protein [Chloroflexota bacterium]
MTHAERHAPPGQQALGAVFSDEEREIYALYRRPGRATFSVDAVALLVIDVTYGLLGPRLPTRQAVDQKRTACGQPGWDAVGRIGPVRARARALGWPVMYTRGASEQHLGGATIGAAEANEDDAIVAELAPAPGELVIEKARASASYGTPLVSYLVGKGVRMQLILLHAEVGEPVR